MGTPPLVLPCLAHNLGGSDLQNIARLARHAAVHDDGAALLIHLDHL